MRVCSVTIDRVAAAPGDHGLGDVGQTERNSVKFFDSSHKLTVLG